MNNLPRDVEILLESSDNKRYKTDERRIGFQEGAKWMREIANAEIEELKAERLVWRTIRYENQNEMEARIIKELETKTDKVIYYIEKKRKFLWWSWWCHETMYHPTADTELKMTYDTHEEALERYNELTQTTTKQVYKPK